MDLSLERDSSMFGSLFNQIITEMKNTSPLWEDFIAKAGKLHACLRAAIQAIAAYLDAFQKIADAATNSRGATKEIGTALTRVCLRHKAVETRLKTFTNAIMDCLVLPLQDKLEDWKRSVVTIDKEHAKEHKRCRAELKKRSSDTLRLQKKARKGQSDTIQSLVDSHMQDVTLRRAELEEVEKKSLRSVMIEERMRYCTFVDMLQPVVKEECEVMSELGHLQEAMQSIALVTKDPNILPQASEELILDAKTVMSLYPESPGGGSGSQGGCSNSLGSRKSSVCSISSMNSSGSSSSPGHHQYQRSLSQFVSPAIRLKPGESRDSGFCSSPALTTQVSNAANQSHAVSTWPPHSQDVVAPPSTDRPHTISTAYEKGHQRPPLTVYTFQNPETIQEGINILAVTNAGNALGQTTPSAQKPSLSRPPLPVRCSSLERPLSTNNNRGGIHGLAQRQCPSPIPAHITKELSVYAQQHQHHHHHQQQQQQQHQLLSSPTYANVSELASMATAKVSNQQQQHPEYQEQHIAIALNSTLKQQQPSDSHNSISSLVPNDSITHNPQNSSILTIVSPNTNIPQGYDNHSHSSTSSSAPPSLHSQHSLDATATMPFVDQTPTPSSDCSTPQNHYSPLLTNSHSSTAVGTPSWGSSGGFGNGTKSSTPTQSVPASDHAICSPPPNALISTAGDLASTEDGIKITDTNITGNGTVPSNFETSIQNAVSFSSANDTESPTIVESDERSRASVLQKASMFEKQAAAAAAANKNIPLSTSGSASVRNNNATTSADNSGGSNFNRESRRIDDYRAPTPVSNPQADNIASGRSNDKSFEDSIQELNNLIGELDSFQREIDESHQNPDKRPYYNSLQQQEQDRNMDEKTDNDNGKARCLSQGLTIAIDTNAAVSSAATTPTLTAAATTLLGYQKLQQKQQQLEAINSTSTISSNQTNSSGCDTDVSDALSEGVSNLNHSKNSNSKNICNNTRNESEQDSSRYYVSETSSLVDDVYDCDELENPNFEHFADSRSELTGDGDITQIPEDISISQQENLESNNVARDASIGSGVVVIYDHQIPITPDIDYVKKNSEIVVLRTKDPRQTQHYTQQEMRELEQLPANLNVLDGSNVIETQNTPITPTPHTATVQPANQRLSSFRTCSEQQLQTSNGFTSNIHLKQHQQPLKGMHTLSTDCRNSLTLAVTIPLLPSTGSAISSPSNESTARSEVLPSKPNLSLFGGKCSNSETSNSSINYMLPQQSYHAPLSPAIRAYFKGDLDAKIRIHKMKLQHQEQYNNIQEQHQIHQHHQQQSNTAISNCNTSRYRSALQFASFSISSSYNEQSHQSTTLPTGETDILFSDLKSNPKLIASLPSSSPSPSPSPPLPHQQGKQYNHNHRQQNHSHLPSLTRSSPTHFSSFMPPTLPQSLSSPPALTLACCFPSVPISSPHSTTKTAAGIITTTATTPPPLSPKIASALLMSPLPLSPSSSSSLLSPSSSHSSISSCTALVIAKPNVLPRPASLSGGATRIARRPSVNAAKPPPPVRRSSSVTPGQNINTIGQYPQQLSKQQQDQHAICLQEQNLPPPPAYLLHDPRQLHTSPTRTRTPTPTSVLSSLPPPPPPSNAIPLATSVSVETNKSQRHLLTSTSGSCKIQNTKNLYLQQQHPLHYNRLQYQQQQNQQHHQQQQQSTASQNMTQKKAPAPNCIIPDASKSPQRSKFILGTTSNDSHSPGQANESLLSPSSSRHENAHEPVYHNQLNPSSSSMAVPQASANFECHSTTNPASPPLLPPPNPKRYYHNHQQHQSQVQQHTYANKSENNNIYSNQSSLRTSSPGIYAQPKTTNNMTSFRSPSPNPNPNNVNQRHHAQAQVPPTQPKTNPNLIAQLSARLNKQPHQQQPGSECCDSGDVEQSVYNSSIITSSNRQNEIIYMRKNGAHRHHHHHQQPQQQQQQQHQLNYDGKSTITTTSNRIYGSFSKSSTNSASASNFHHTSSPHFPLSSSTSSLLSKVTSFSSTSSPKKSAAFINNHQQNHEGNFQNSTHLNLSQLNLNQQNVGTSLSNRSQLTCVASAQYHHHHQQYNRENSLEDPPLPPKTATGIAKSVAGSSATMPKNCSRSSSISIIASSGDVSQNVTTARVISSVSATLPKNLQQQRFLFDEQQQHQHQYQNQQQLIEFNSGAALHHHYCQYASNTNDNNDQRPQMPLSHQNQQHQQQQQLKHIGSDYSKQPPIPTRQSSVQQKIYVTTNPFIRTTAVQRMSAGVAPRSITPGNCSSGIADSIYTTTDVGRIQQHYSQQHQQHYVTHSTNPIGHHSTSSIVATHSNYATSSNLEKNTVVGCGSIHLKTKAEFMENLNAKLAKQGISGRAFAVRNLINSKALPDPRLCHESLMDQIKRGATLKRNQKINDRSAPKIR